LYYILGQGSPFFKIKQKKKDICMLDSHTLSVQQILCFRGYENFERYTPVSKDEQVWFTLKDLRTGEIIKKVAMTPSGADSRNKKIRDSDFAWVRI
jgi:hypothetical protein